MYYYIIRYRYNIELLKIGQKVCNNICSCNKTYSPLLQDINFNPIIINKYTRYLYILHIFV